MKTLFILFLFISPIVIITSCEEDIIDANDTMFVSKTKTMHFKKDMTLVTGLVREYDNNGALINECKFKKGKMNGVYRHWDNGELEETFWKDGVEIKE